jgi:hypothetical protein
MRALYLAFLAVLFSPPALGAQEPTIVFRSEINVVQLNYVLVMNGAPMVGLAPVDFSVVIDKKLAVPVTVVADPATPGGYHLHFSPPESVRNGKKHRVEITIKNWSPKPKQRPLVLKTSVTFPKLVPSGR